MKKTLLLKTMILVAILLVSTLPLWANHVVVENVSITDQNAASDYTHIKFDISWENSWRVSTGPSNWDAAWVFAKWKLHSGTDWAHCTLSSTDGDHTAPSGSTIDAASDGTGIFIYRSSDGSGSNNWDNVKLRWNYGTDGVADDATVDVRVLAIEMVYIPQGSFTLTDVHWYREDFSSGNTISSEDSIPEGEITWDAGSKGSGSQDADGRIGGCAALGANYPKGYKAIYCMKYEISQGQYADFLSMLTDAQDDNRYPNKNGNDRHTISGSYGNYSASVPDRACNYLSWTDGLAYADWAGLRPMTELEFEKICRGPETPVCSYYAWGNSNIASSAYTLSNDGQYDESIATNYANEPTGNASYNITVSYGGIKGPLRCGIFATSTSTRAESGATYYGVMQMSGNLFERVITVAKYCWAPGYSPVWQPTNAGLYDGQHGDGSLSSTGYANDVPNWPSATATPTQFYSAFGAGRRGSSWMQDEYYGHQTTRIYAAQPVSYRQNDYGFRLVRTQ